MSNFTLEWVIPKERAGKDIKTFLSEEHISRRALTDIKFAGGTISVNGKEENVRYFLDEGDRLEIVFPPEPVNPRLAQEHIPLDIIYEDRDILVINKPPYMSTIPSREHPSGSVANALAYYYEHQGSAKAAVHIVTRLDRNTSGLLLVAKHRHAHHLFGLQQKEAIIHRAYEAIAAGTFWKKRDVIDVPIGRKQTSIIEREVRRDGKRAVTVYEVQKQMKDAAFLKIKLETGRTHQIRVHLSHIGHPLFGDELYGGPMNGMMRQALHCSELSFFHPLTKKEMFFNAPLPQDMQMLLEELEIRG
ncbi:RluA family pseudouridine synthase [Siminovitchia fortis]|uniref:Pseudouridine synthase n=1 Tax=Siminovitchia fortis TaxID=254758 RepID=A0A443IKK0_9BACI|nr:RluA family pseudouridine synthase [Siminovitchia fortis]RWR05551.1 RluA family pseudouridine synthase [Siminovitchia fortis]WHY83549.1 RluA family pseudouridine synthase [Siminovitchia fortis]